MAANLNGLRRGLVLGAALAAALASLCACDMNRAGVDKPSFHGVDISGAEYARTLNLPDFNGQARTLADFKGKLPVVFFGYTQCPDACPTTMAELAEVKRSLGADGDRVIGVFVTVDPERDSANSAIVVGQASGHWV